MSDTTNTTDEQVLESIDRLIVNLRSGRFLGPPPVCDDILSRAATRIRMLDDNSLFFMAISTMMNIESVEPKPSITGTPAKDVVRGERSKNVWHRLDPEGGAE